VGQGLIAESKATQTSSRFGKEAKVQENPHGGKMRHKGSVAGKICGRNDCLQQGIRQGFDVAAITDMVVGQGFSPNCKRGHCFEAFSTRLFMIVLFVEADDM
jgi:hypothetical protein